MADTKPDRLYPHLLQIKNGSGEWVTISKCEDQPNTGGETTTTANRTDYLFKSLIFIPVSDVSIKPGQDIKVLGTKGEKRLEDKAVRFSADELNYRLWV
jgi:hypothetical protein